MLFILQARMLEWAAVPSSRGFSKPRDWTQISRIAGRFFTSWATMEAPMNNRRNRLTSKNKLLILHWRKTQTLKRYKMTAPEKWLKQSNYQEFCPSFWCPAAILEPPALCRGCPVSPLVRTSPAWRCGAQRTRWAPLPNPVAGAQASRQSSEPDQAGVFPQWEAALEFMCIFLESE